MKAFIFNVQFIERMFKNMNLFSGASLKTLYTLALDPMRSFYQREVAKEALVSVGSANRVLPIFVKQGLVTRETKGKVFLYRYNLGDPVARQLKTLFNVLEMKELVDDLRPIAMRVILFGSSSRGRDVKESDVDLFILTNQKDEALKKVRQHEAKRRLAPIIVDVDEYTNLRNKDRPLYDEINRGISLWERS